MTSRFNWSHIILFSPYWFLETAVNVVSISSLRLCIARKKVLENYFMVSDMKFVDFREMSPLLLNRMTLEVTICCLWITKQIFPKEEPLYIGMKLKGRMVLFKSNTPKLKFPLLSCMPSTILLIWGYMMGMFWEWCLNPNLGGV